MYDPQKQIEKIMEHWLSRPKLEHTMEEIEEEYVRVVYRRHLLPCPYKVPLRSA